MSPKRATSIVDVFFMTITFRSKRRTTDNCVHSHQVHMEIAGMSRAVCETCGRVSVGYVENHIRRSTRAQFATETAGS